MSHSLPSLKPSGGVCLWAVCGLVAVSLTQGTNNHSGLARGAGCLSCYQSDMGRFPVRGSLYEMTNPPVVFQGSQLPVPIELVQLELRSVAPLSVLPPPGTSSTVDSFFDITYRVGPSGGPYHIDSFFDVFTELSLTTQSISPSSGEVQVEMLSMDLQGEFPGPTGPIPFRVRESPTLPSLGHHSYSEQPGGGFQVDSFFDVFTEISLDGTTWTQASGPFRMELTRVGIPEPASLMLAGVVSMVGLAVRIRCRGRKA